MNNQDHAEWNIEIDRVVIEGIRLTSYQQQLLKESLQTELGRMFTDRAVSGDVKPARGKVFGTPIRLSGPDPAPDQLGKQIAASVYNTII